ncbi:TPA: DUF916 domain-containing protein [Candidatus Saccharibacteria bacterium]|nr:DUF916 domain-containing protein [Candidatus Saccharibacteria bacterium]HIO87810.1 DUF916 domain-containing protein [Candidatus Saccharibacteria bacterium]
MVTTLRRSLALLGLIAAVTLVALFNLSSTSAQDAEPGNALSISPFKFELDANPGDSIERTIRVTNNADVQQDISILVKNFTADGEEGQVNLTEDATSYSIAEWVTVNKSESTIPGRTSETYTFTIDVPENAEPGGHFGSVVFATDPVEVEGDQSGATVSGEIAALLLVRIDGDIEEEISVASFEAGVVTTDANDDEVFDEKSSFENGPVTFETRFKNDGNVHLAPTGTITIKNMFGSVVETLQLEEQNVLPDAVRRSLAEWDPGFSVGTYTAELEATYGENSTVITAETSFTIFPWKVLVPVFLAVVAVIVVLVKGRGRIASAFKALEGKNTADAPKKPAANKDDTSSKDNS